MYEREYIDLNKNCLVIVDLQKGFINEYTAHLPMKIADFIDKHQIFNSIVATRYCNSVSSACYKLGGWHDCMINTSAASLVSEINDYVQRTFDKQTFSGFTSEFNKFLEEQNFDKVYFCGVNTDCCVLATVFSCYDSVQDCTVISDLCASTLGLEKHNNAIELIKDNITEQRVIYSSILDLK